MAAPLAFTFAAGAIAWALRGTQEFAPGVCERLQPYLQYHIVGQELALRQFSDAACDLIRRSTLGSTKPLVISVHGPPGVGKSLTHMLAAKALYNSHPLADDQCPGRSCPGYKVVYGMDYVVNDRQNQHNLLRAALLSHLRSVRRAVIVIEEYDKAGCETRSMLRQLFNNLRVANITGGLAPIVLLESNTGYTQIQDMVKEAGDRSKVDAEGAQRMLKDLVFENWDADGCEDRIDTIKMVSMVDFFLPYLPLEKVHIRKLFQMRLAEEAADLLKNFFADLVWDDAVIDFLVSKVDFDEGYAMEGGKEVSSVATRHVTRLLRPWRAERGGEEQTALSPLGTVAQRVFSSMQQLMGGPHTSSYEHYEREEHALTGKRQPPGMQSSILLQLALDAEPEALRLIVSSK